MQLTLRPFRESDLDDFYGWAGDDAVTRFMKWDAFATKESKAILIDCDNPSPVVQGHLNYWGVGIATEAVMRAVQAGFSDIQG
ncbi:hypothetical protein SUGI_0688670 [Cryptomeria japonica]|nr:hypothetical protein SUGI_0688670 [Cryptomeria japonica]